MMRVLVSTKWWASRPEVVLPFGAWRGRCTPLRHGLWDAAAVKPSVGGLGGSCERRIGSAEGVWLDEYLCR